MTSPPDTSGADSTEPALVLPADTATRARLRALAERTLSVEEWNARLAVPITAEEHENTMELVRWFRRRYPTPADRLAYVRRAYKRWAGTY